MKTSVINLVLTGSRKEDKIDYETFSHQVSKFHSLLKAIQEEGNHDVSFEIKTLSYDSPLSTAIEVKGHGSANFTENFAAINNELKALFEDPDAMHKDMIDSVISYPRASKKIFSKYKDLATPVSEMKLSEATIGISIDSKTISSLPITDTGYIKLKDIIQHSFLGNIKSYDSFAGKLIEIKLLEKYSFTIRRNIGYKINCIFTKDMLPKVKSLLNQDVTVAGLVSYSDKSSFPNKLIVKELAKKIRPEKQVSIMDLQGLAPDITDGKDSVEFIREMRDSDDDDSKE